MTWSFTLVTFRQPLITWRWSSVFTKTTPPSHLSLSDGHPVVMHLVKTEVSVGMQGLSRYKVSISDDCTVTLNVKVV